MKIRKITFLWALVATVLIATVISRAGTSQVSAAYPDSPTITVQSSGDVKIDVGSSNNVFIQAGDYMADWEVSHDVNLGNRGSFRESDSGSTTYQANFNKDVYTTHNTGTHPGSAYQGSLAVTAVVTNFAGTDFDSKTLQIYYFW